MAQDSLASQCWPSSWIVEKVYFDRLTFRPFHPIFFLNLKIISIFYCYCGARHGEKNLVSCNTLAEQNCQTLNFVTNKKADNTNRWGWFHTVSVLGRDKVYKRSNITLCPKEFPRAKPKGTPEGKGLYLTVYPESSPNKDIISFQQSIG